jgi:signal transduction histidine kinase
MATKYRIAELVGALTRPVVCDREIVIRVSDTGPGIPETEREAVTKRF